MAINKKLIHFERFTNFNSKKLSANKENTAYTLGISGEVQSGTPEILYQSIVYIKDTQQQWTHGCLYNGYMNEGIVNSIINTKFFIGTSEEYDAVAENVAIGAIVILTDQTLPSGGNNGSGTSAKLGTGILGQLILGNN